MRLSTRSARWAVAAVALLAALVGVGFAAAPHVGWATPFSLPSHIRYQGLEYFEGEYQPCVHCAERLPKSLRRNVFPARRVGSVFGYFTSSKPVLLPRGPGGSDLTPTATPSSCFSVTATVPCNTRKPLIWAERKGVRRHSGTLAQSRVLARRSAAGAQTEPPVQRRDLRSLRMYGLIDLNRLRDLPRLGFTAHLEEVHLLHISEEVDPPHSRAEGRRDRQTPEASLDEFPSGQGEIDEPDRLVACRRGVATVRHVVRLLTRRTWNLGSRLQAIRADGIPSAELPCAPPPHATTTRTKLHR